MIKKPVDMLNIKTGKIVKSFDCLISAGHYVRDKGLALNKASRYKRKLWPCSAAMYIARACRDNGEAFGYRWKFIIPETMLNKAQAELVIEALELCMPIGEYEFKRLKEIKKELCLR